MTERATNDLPKEHNMSISLNGQPPKFEFIRRVPGNGQNFPYNLIHTYRQTDRQANRQTERQTERHTRERGTLQSTQLGSNFREFF
uniref:Uncharacterized protein n=1 Tax=Haemonchus contortus TaxID=6289 RepID=A0A7I4YU47_HAECO